MTREQMICIVTPRAPANVAASVQRRVDKMCKAIGRIHFATLALLPAPPDASAMAEPSLLLEVVVDEDLPPAELIDLMLQFGFGVLWRLYKVNWTGPQRANPASKREWLRAFLSRHANGAGCGFVGARDRSVAQVIAENRLFKQVRKVLRTLPPSRRPTDSRMLAEIMVDWAGRHGFAWTAEAPPRSFWRLGRRPAWLHWTLLSIRLVVPFLAVLGLLTTVGAVVTGFAHVLSSAGLPIPDHGSTMVLLGALALLVVLLPIFLSTFVGFGALGLAFAILLVIPLTLTATVSVLAANLWVTVCMLELGGLGLATVLAFAASAASLALVPIVVTLRAPPFFPVVFLVSVLTSLWLLVVGVAQWMLWVMKSLPCQALAWSPLPSPDLPTKIIWTVSAIAVVGAVIAIVILLFVRGLRRRAKVGPWLDRPAPLPTAPAHQVHPSVQACEATLSRRTGHMISLTEIRRPYAYHRFWLRFWLWFINLLGEVFFTEGRLGQASGIKFGHWQIIGEGRRLLFCSNYDGAFGGYLDQFISGAAEGANLLWRRTELRPRKAARHDHPAVQCERSFPPTRMQIFSGCKSEQAFKAYARASMVPHLHRFEAYCLSNDDIERGTRLREAMRGTHTAIKDDQIARALES